MLLRMQRTHAPRLTTVGSVPVLTAIGRTAAELWISARRATLSVLLLLCKLVRARLALVAMLVIALLRLAPLGSIRTTQGSALRALLCPVLPLLPRIRVPPQLTAA